MSVDTVGINVGLSISGGLIPGAVGPSGMLGVILVVGGGGPPTAEGQHVGIAPSNALHTALPSSTAAA